VKPTIFVSIKTRTDQNHVKNGIENVVKALGAEPVDQFKKIQEKVLERTKEADIIVTNSVVTALGLACRTNHAIVLVYYEDEQEKIDAFADYLPDYVFPVPFTNSTASGENQFVPFLAKLIAKEKEKHRVHV
jgi:hypothetical protein